MQIFVIVVASWSALALGLLVVFLCLCRAAQDDDALPVRSRRSVSRPVRAASPAARSGGDRVALRRGSVSRVG